MRNFIVLAVVMLPATVAMAQLNTPNEGYYQGQSTLYPYDWVFTASEDGHSQGYGAIGEMLGLPKSAPLPPGQRWCKWADITDPKRLVPDGQGWVSMTGEGWYQWEPRIMPPERAKYLGERVCYFEDRGVAKNINDFQRGP